MFNRTLTTILGIICLLTFSLSEDKFSSFRELKKDIKWDVNYSF